MFEGQATTATVTVTSTIGATGPEAVGDVVAAALEPGPWLRTEPIAAAAAAACQWHRGPGRRPPARASDGDATRSA